MSCWERNFHHKPVKLNFRNHALNRSKSRQQLVHFNASAVMIELYMAKHDHLPMEGGLLLTHFEWDKGRNRTLRFLCYVSYVDCRRMAGYSGEKEGRAIAREDNEFENLKGVPQLQLTWAISSYPALNSSSQSISHSFTIHYSSF